MKDNIKDLHTRKETLRQNIIRLLKENRFTAKELSKLIGISEKDVYFELESVARSENLQSEPSRCKICGFIFKKRDRLSKPSRCPICKNSSITDPVFFISD